jgi:hypothetical protein
MFTFYQRKGISMLEFGESRLEALKKDGAVTNMQTFSYSKMFLGVLNCLLSRVLNCLLSRVLNCLLSRVLNCLLSRVLNCLLSRVLNCLLSRLCAWWKELS